ncbi:MAG: hypothetical protein NVV63_15345 [Opitutus sp.]|nr:hypothetical protein [Opitutus sp.]
MRAASVDEREEQGVVDDDDVRGAQTRASALIEAAIAIAVLARTRRGIGVDGVPDFRARRRTQLVTQSGIGRLGPRRDALQFIVVGIGKETRAISERVRETRRAQVIGFSDQHGRAEIGVGFERLARVEQTSADRKIFRLELFLQRDRVRGDDHLPRLIDGVDDPRNEVGQRFADACAGLEEQGNVVGDRRGNGARHLFLFGTMLERETFVQPSALREDVRRQLRGATLRWSRHR